ncbi:MAG: ABC transporter ATP-binding protein [Acidobacteriia bacterium]|nr:ABC transporter ATP-binding protein [Terriglobia bacterium]
MESAIRCRDLRKRYKTRNGSVDAVNGLDLDVGQGECFGLLGPNGAGKTTTIEILEGLLDASSGEVSVLGRRWGEHDDELRQRLGISLQETRFPEKLTVYETLVLFRSFYRDGNDPAEVMKEVGLSEKQKSWVGKLSGGQRQRLAVACALVGNPELLFLDEPTTGLDPQSRRQLWEIIRRLGEQGRTTLLTTHYMDEAERLCGRVAVVDHGEIIALGSPAELIAGLGGDHVVEFALANGSVIAEAELASLPAVREVRKEAAGMALTVTEPHVTIPALLQILQHRGFDLIRLTTRHVSLEDVFVHLTGRRLRDEEISSS